MLKLQHPPARPMSHATSFYPPLPPPRSSLHDKSSYASSTRSNELDRSTNVCRPSLPPAIPASDVAFASKQHNHTLFHATQKPVNTVQGTDRRFNGDTKTYLNSALPPTSVQDGRRPPSSRPDSSTPQHPTSEMGHRRKTSNTSNNAIATQLQIPNTISTPQASLLQLTAEITCLFWFESSSTLQAILKPGSPKATLPLCAEAIPTTGFKKWVAMILSTTQVAQNVILLALLFIYRLKKINPGVRGKNGSEYRLLTVALMLGNKFLDDNTYTNKTWAEVSGIFVEEIHMMEVEFLQNMKYNLFTSEEEWKEWHVIVGKFGTAFDAMLRARLEAPKLSGSMTPTLNFPTPSSTLPSPPVSHYASPPYASTGRFSPTHQLSTTPLLLPQITSSTVSPIVSLPDPDLRFDARKRSHEDSNVEPPAKRQIRQFTPSVASTSSSAGTPLSSSGPVLPRLPALPSLSIPPSHVADAPVQVMPHLPLPGNRAMSLVYPPPVQWTQTPPPISLPAVSGAPLPSPNTQAMHDPSRQLSPFTAGSVGNSPINANFPPSAGAQNPGRLSPSYLLAQRQSPYRPVRRVNTLLHPPPNTIMQNGPPKSIPWDQMQYQQLGRPERRAGTLPYMHHEAWPQTNQFNQWPILPQPNFSRV